MVTLNQLPLAPSKQLDLLQRLAVATLEQGAPRDVEPSLAAAHEDTDWLYDTEMC